MFPGIESRKLVSSLMSSKSWFCRWNWGFKKPTTMCAFVSYWSMVWSVYLRSCRGVNRITKEEKLIGCNFYSVPASTYYLSPSSHDMPTIRRKYILCGSVSIHSEENFWVKFIHVCMSCIRLGKQMPAAFRLLSIHTRTAIIVESRSV